MIDGLKLFSALEENGTHALDLVQKKNFSPNLQKTLRTWGAKDAADLVGKNRGDIYHLEEKGVFPQPEINPKNNRKFYTLQDINRMRDYFNTRPSKPQNASAMQLAIMNYKGGVGKSETSISLSHYFALKGYRVLLIDLDNQASSTHSFGYIPDRDISRDETLFPFMVGEEKNIKNLIKKTYWDGLDLIPANLTLFNAEFQIPVMQYQASQRAEKFSIYNILEKGMEQINNDYDIILYDCSPSMGIISMNALYAANAIVIPSPPSMLDLSSVIQFFGMATDVLERLPKKYYHFIRVLISKCDTSDSGKLLTNIIRRSFGDQVLISTIPFSEAIKKCRALMKSIYETEKYSGSKSTLDRIKLQSNAVAEEIETLVLEAWKDSVLAQKQSTGEAHD